VDVATLQDIPSAICRVSCGEKSVLALAPFQAKHQFAEASCGDFQRPVPKMVFLINFLTLLAFKNSNLIVV